MFDAARARFVSLCAPFVRTGGDFVQRLALCSAQLHGVVRSAPLLARSPELGSLAAGLPFFASGFMRNWGRDTFISLRGLLLITGRFADAKNIILAYAHTALGRLSSNDAVREAASVRHGLGPTLLDGGRKPRFNCRDAPWWFLQAVQDYVTAAGVAEGDALLAAPVERLFEGKGRMALADVVQEIVQAHASGIDFREVGAGPELDSHMTTEGFNVSIRLDPATGFVSGGNAHNCGTWMDKMGESQSAGNKVPRRLIRPPAHALAGSARHAPRRRGGGNRGSGGVRRAVAGGAGAGGALQAPRGRAPVGRRLHVRRVGRRAEAEL